MAEQTATLARREIDLGDGSGKQVFEAENEALLADKLVTAQEHASRKIREQQQELDAAKGRLAQLEAATEPPATTGNGFDKEAYFSTMYADPLKAVDQWAENRFGMPMEKLVERFGVHDRAAETLNTNVVAGAFARRHPELLQVTPDQDLANSKAIDAVMVENGWPYTENNLEAAMLVAQRRGKIVLPSAAVATEIPEPPATISGGGGGASNVDEAQVLAGMTLEQRKNYLSAKHARLRAGA